MSSWVALVAPAEREVNNDGIQKGKKKVRRDQVRQKIWPRKERANESDSEKGTKMMGRNKGYPRRIEVLSLRGRGTEFISSPIRSKTAAQAALMKWQDATNGENDKVNMRRERLGKGWRKQKKKISAQNAPSTLQDARWMVAA
jgi:hypothetical protein